MKPNKYLIFAIIAHVPGCDCSHCIWNLIFFRQLFFSFFRFSPTRPPVHWTGVRSAMSYSPVCPQGFPEVANETEALQKMPKRRLDYLNKVIPQLRTQSEDCLFLNIYVPSKCQLNWIVTKILIILGAICIRQYFI